MGVTEPNIDIRTGREYEVSPRIGSWQKALFRLVQRVSIANGSEEVLSHVESEIQAVNANGALEGDIDIDALKYLFVLLVVRDILNVGGSVRVLDSQLYVGWPDWSAENGRQVARKALNSVTDSSYSPDRRKTVDDLFAGSLTPQETGRVLGEGNIALRAANEVHPSGTPYSEAFTFALKYWSMPYRGREGRTNRYVVVVEHPEVLNAPKVLGLLEVGDDGPFNKKRDRFLGLDVETFVEWLEAAPDKERMASAVAEYFEAVRGAVLPIEGVEQESAEEILKDERHLAEEARGRSVTGERLYRKKRIAYLLRLAHGERAMKCVAGGQSPTGVMRSIKRGVRALHNLVLPRVHMEATICGAVPPFSYALGGKLVVGFFGHPMIIESTKGRPGRIMRKTFDEGLITELLPNSGLIGLTTKGLYPEHSALYNRAEVPTGDGAVRLEKIGTSSGISTTLIRKKAVDVAKRLAAASRDTVSDTYGSGGAKRQRILEAACNEVGLPDSIVHAGINRPMYGVHFTDNPMDIMWAGSEPKWRIYRDKDDYSNRVIGRWRERWGKTVTRRLNDRDDELDSIFRAMYGTEG